MSGEGIAQGAANDPHRLVACTKPSGRVVDSDGLRRKRIHVACSIAQG
jgi:hypothetical protein